MKAVNLQHHGEVERPLLAVDTTEGPQSGTSTVATFFIFLKSYLGSGLMAMAGTYLSGGLFAVTALIYFVAALSCVSFVLVFAVRDRLLEGLGADEVRLRARTLSFERVVETVLGRWGRWMVVGSLVFTQAGFATAYTIFIANNLNLLYPVLSMRSYALLLVPPTIALCWIRQLRFIYPVAMAGMGAIGLAVITVAIYAFGDSLVPNGVNWNEALQTPWATLPVAFGVVVYLFEGVGLILPLETKMRNRGHFPAIMWGTHLSVATLVALFGMMGFFAFGARTCSPIIGNLPTSGWLVVLTVWGLNVSLLFTFPIQMVPVFELAEEWVDSWSCGLGRGSARGVVVRNLVIRAAIVVLCISVGIAIPFFGLFLSLIGGLGSAQLMFILPPLTYYFCFRATISRRATIGCALILAFGVATLLVTSAFTLMALVEKFQNPNPTNGTCGSPSLGHNVTALMWNN